MPLVQKCARPEFANASLVTPRRVTVQVKPVIVPKKLYIVSGRFLIPNTRVVAAIPTLRIFAIDVNDVARQIRPAVEAHVTKEHAKDLPRDRGVKVKYVPLSIDFLKMNLQIVEYASTVRAVVVEVPAVAVQARSMDAVDIAKLEAAAETLSADWQLMVEADTVAEAVAAACAEGAPSNT